jgi:hypothetical protein
MMNRASITTILAASLLAASPAALAQTPEPVGVEPCDRFLAAHELCVASAPEAARPAMRQSIEQSRANWREAVRRDERARRPVAAQCRQSLETIGGRLQQAYGCSFPAP